MTTIYLALTAAECDVRIVANVRSAGEAKAKAAADKLVDAMKDMGYTLEYGQICP